MLGNFLPIHDAESLPSYRMASLYWPKWNALCAVRAKNGVFRPFLCLKGQCAFTWAKVKCARVVNTVMWLPVALAAWGHVLLHSTSHQVYTCHIPRIYLVYANENVIYQVYSWYILMGKSIYQVYTWYIPCINLSYDNVKYIPDIHLLKTFCIILVPVTWQFSDGIYQVYTWLILSIWWVQTITWQPDRYQNVAESFE